MVIIIIIQQKISIVIDPSLLRSRHFLTWYIFGYYIVQYIFHGHVLFLKNRWPTGVPLCLKYTVWDTHPVTSCQPRALRTSYIVFCKEHLNRTVRSLQRHDFVAQHETKCCRTSFISVNMACEKWFRFTCNFISGFNMVRSGYYSDLPNSTSSLGSFTQITWYWRLKIW